MSWQISANRINFLWTVIYPRIMGRIWSSLESGARCDSDPCACIEHILDRRIKEYINFNRTFYELAGVRPNRMPQFMKDVWGLLPASFKGDPSSGKPSLSELIVLIRSYCCSDQPLKFCDDCESLEEDLELSASAQKALNYYKNNWLDATDQAAIPDEVQLSSKEVCCKLEAVLDLVMEAAMRVKEHRCAEGIQLLLEDAIKCLIVIAGYRPIVFKFSAFVEAVVDLYRHFSIPGQYQACIPAYDRACSNGDI